MKKWQAIVINTDDVDKLLTAIQDNKDKNPGCKLINYWQHRWGEKILNEVKETKRLPYGFVGDGWPKKTDQSWALKHDTYKLSKAFLEHDCRDIGDAIYQANIISEYLVNKKGHIYIVDFGSGYGRLAIPFIHKFRGMLTYIGIDYTACGLLIAPQFVEQAIDAKVKQWDDETNDYKSYDFVSLPAWNIHKLYADYLKVDAFISVHSIQEMQPETINFYVRIMPELCKKNAIFYSINIESEDKKIVLPSQYREVFSRPFPINRDGSYNEKLSKIK